MVAMAFRSFTRDIRIRDSRRARMKPKITVKADRDRVHSIPCQNRDM